MPDRTQAAPAQATTPIGTVTAVALQQLQEGQLRIEAKLDILINALADEEPEPARTLEGMDAGQERDQSQSLDRTDTTGMG